MTSEPAAPPRHGGDSPRLPSLILFARVPLPGRVKTRLQGRYGGSGALNLYRAFLRDASRLYGGTDVWDPVVAVEPDAEHPQIALLFPPPWRRESQPAGDLGVRLKAAFAREFDAGAPASIAVGSDHPALGPAALAQTLARARAEGAAVVPAEDGGYCAIALSAGISLEAAFSGIPWSTPAVLETTRTRLAGAGVSLSLMPPGYDVDVAEDVERLRRDLAGRDPAGADFPAATFQALSELA